MIDGAGLAAVTVHCIVALLVSLTVLGFIENEMTGGTRKDNKGQGYCF